MFYDNNNNTIEPNMNDEDYYYYHYGGGQMILVDGELIALPPSAHHTVASYAPPPPNDNHHDPPNSNHPSSSSQERFYRSEPRNYHPTTTTETNYHSSVCQPSRVRRGVRKIGKFLRLHRKKKDSGVSTSKVNLVQQQQLVPPPSLPSEENDHQNHIHHDPSTIQNNNNNNMDIATMPSTGGTTTTTTTITTSTSTTSPTRGISPPSTETTTASTTSNTAAPHPRRSFRQKKHPFWNRQQQQQQKSSSYESLSDLFHPPPQLSNEFNTSSALLPPSVPPPPTTTTTLPNNNDNNNTNTSLETNQNNNAVTRASFVGTEDQLLEAGVLPAAYNAVAYYFEDDEKKQDTTTTTTAAAASTTNNNNSGLFFDESISASEQFGFTTPVTTDFKVDKADAPNFEDMLLRAAHENHADILEEEVQVSSASWENHSFPPHASVLRKQKSDATASVPLSLSQPGDTQVHNDTLKCILVSSHSIDKSVLSRAIRKTATKRSSRRKRLTLGVDVHTWHPEHSGIQFKLWDVQGATRLHDDDAPNFGAHLGTQSLFFSSNALYMLVWDLGWYNPLTKISVDLSEEEDDYDDDDDFIQEERNRQADRALVADIQDQILSWVDCIARRGKQTAILPVVVIPEDIEQEELNRRCFTMQRLLEQYVDRYTDTKLLMGAENMMCVNFDSGFGVEELRKTLEDIVESKSVFEHVGTPVPKGTVEVLAAVNRFKQQHKLILLDHMIGELGQQLEVDTIVEALLFLSDIGEILYFGDAGDDVLSRYIILNRKWLVSAISCILRNDLKRELVETRRFMNMQCLYSDQEFAESQVIKTLLGGTGSSCPLLSDSDAKMLWQSMSFMREAADTYSELTENSTSAPTMFYFLERLLVHSNIFLPLDISNASASLDHSEVFFVPSLLPRASQSNVWTYKSNDSWMTTLCHSWVFRDGAPSDMMERLMVQVVKNIYELSRDFQGTAPRANSMERERTVSGSRVTSGALHQFIDEHPDQAIGRIKIHQIVCWQSSIQIKIGTIFTDQKHDELRESFVEILVTCVDQSSPLCVGADAMRAGSQRVIVSGKGQVGAHGRKLWKGGYKAVVDGVHAILEHHANVDSQVICPECLAHAHPHSAATWSHDSVLAAADSRSSRILCMRGHRVDSNLISGQCKMVDLKAPPLLENVSTAKVAKSVPELLPSVVVVGLWDADLKEVRNVGSGFIVDRKNGLIVTAGHILFNMEEGRQFGAPYFGVTNARVVIGIVSEGGDCAVFRYFAEIITDDVHSVDACVLRITSRFRDVEEVSEAGATVLPLDIMEDNLKSLKLTSRFELEENVRVLGFNQGGEGVLEVGKHINRTADFAKGYVCKIFKAQINDDDSHSSDSTSLCTFTPREEIVIMCPTIKGHSGGPCVNEEGKVLGILSRADPSDPQRCYLVPSTELKTLVSKARKICMGRSLKPLKTV